MATDQRIYKVISKDETFLVQAASQAQALRHIAGKQYQIEVAKAVDVAHIMTNGGTVECATTIAEQTELPGMNDPVEGEQA